MGKKYGVLFVVVCVLGAAAVVDYRLFIDPVALPGRASLEQGRLQKDSDNRLKEIYKLTLDLSKTTMGAVNTYLPKYRPMDFAGATYIFTMFGFGNSAADMESRIRETDDYYYCSDGEGALHLYKYTNRLHYIARREQKDEAGSEKAGSVIQSDDEALSKALSFMESKFLFLSYEESEINFDGEVYNIRLINRIGNIRNYAFTTDVKLSRSGRVLEMVYHNMTYERLSSSRTKSMHDAFLELPVDFPEGVTITLTSCNPVYIYENSIVQPAFLFEGIDTSGNTFQSFIKAAIFE